MIKEVANNWEIQYVLDNLRQEDEIELFSLYGTNWKEKTFECLKNKVVNVLYGFDSGGILTPIAIGGFNEEKDSKIACVWLLSTPLISGNKQLFFSELSRQFKKAEQKYEIMYNFIYKSNYTAKGWLKHFGFKFDNPKPKGIGIGEDFEFFYKVIERKK